MSSSLSGQLSFDKMRNFFLNHFFDREGGGGGVLPGGYGGMWERTHGRLRAEWGL